MDKNEILKNYRNRLINFNSRNRILCTSRLAKKRGIDLKKIDKIEADISESIYELLTDKSIREVKLCENYLSVNLNKNDLEEIKIKIEKEKIYAEDERAILYQNALETKKEKLMVLYKEISILQNEVISQILEKGQNNLYLGYPFIEGRMLDESNVRGPIFLFPMKLEKREEGWFLIKRVEDPILFNKTFYLAYKTVYHETIEDFEGEFDTIQDIVTDIQTENLVEIAQEYLKIKKIRFSPEIISEFEEMRNYVKGDFNAKYPVPELNIKRYLILGDYAISENAIYKDYESIMESEENSLIDSLLKDEEIGDGSDYYEKDNIQIQESECHFVTELDYSQEKAVKLVEKKGSLVIYGPPGTGKSQVIANLVSDNLAKGKKVLVVSEKRTALDVVYKRLESCGLSQRMAFVHDSKTDRGLLFEKIVEILEEVYSKEKIKNISIDEISFKIQSKLDNLDKLAEKIHTKGKNGLSLFQLYSLSDSELYQNDFIRENYNEFQSIRNDELEDIFKKLSQLYKNLEFDREENFYIKNRNSFSGITEVDLNHLRQKLKDIEFRNYYSEIKDFLKNVKRDTKILQDFKNQEFEEYKNTTIKNLLNQLWVNLKKERNSLEENLEHIKKLSLLTLENIIDKRKEQLKNIDIFEEEIRSIEKFYSREIFSEIDIINNEIQNMERMFFLNPQKYLLKARIEKKINSRVSEEKNNINRWSMLRKDFKELFGNIEYKEIKSLYMSEINREKNTHLQAKKLFEDNLELIKNLSNLEEILQEKILKIKDEFPEEFSEYILKVDDYVKDENVIKKLENLEIILFDIEGFCNISNVKYLEEIKNILQEKERIKEENYSRLEKIRREMEFADNFNFNSLCGMKTHLEKIGKVILPEELEISEGLKKIEKIIEKVEEEFLKINEFKNFFNENSYETMRKNIFYNEREHLIRGLQNYLELRSTEIINHDCIKEKLSEEGKKIYEHILDESNKKETGDYLKILKNSFYLEWIKIEVQGSNEILSSIDGYESLKKEIIELMATKKRIIPHFIIEKLNGEISKRFKFSKAGNELHYRDMLKEVQKKRKLLPLRKFVEYFSPRGLFDILPCWLLSPDIVSEIMPTKSGMFDVVIFDEASQMLVEKGIPSIYRGKNVVVAGDDKQLQPTTIGQKTINTGDNPDDEVEELDEYEEYQDTTAITEKSLLDMAKLRYASSKLSFHYRSKFEELINFSNYAFYNGELQTPPNLSNDSNEPPIRRIKVDGEWRDRTNEREAEEIYGLLKEIFYNRKENESIGIITFNASQQEFIREYLEEKAMRDLEFRAVYAKELERYDDTEDRSLFIKNIENVQGDERDIIIFSVAYAKDSTGKLKTQFGSLSQQGGENRLNVAISRAKKKIYVVTSFEPEELMVENSKNLGPKLLKKYLRYVRAISSDDKESAKSILNELSIKIKTSEIMDSFDSIFEEQVCDALRNEKLKFEIHTQVGDSGYRIDLGVFDPSISSYVLGIECDGATYHSTPSARERDIYRQKFLENKGWKIHRIWSRDWWNNPNKEIEKILKKLSG